MQSKERKERERRVQSKTKTRVRCTYDIVRYDVTAKAKKKTGISQYHQYMRNGTIGLAYEVMVSE